MEKTPNFRPQKQTQTNPNKANPTPIFPPLWHPKPKAKPSKAKQTQFPKEPRKSTQLVLSKGLTKKMPIPPPPEQTQTDPICRRG
jgi:hypothetical protein